MAKARSYHCSNCREDIGGEGLNRVSIGQNRWVVFCGMCNCFVSLEDPTLIARVTKKSVHEKAPEATPEATPDSK